MTCSTAEPRCGRGDDFRAARRRVHSGRDVKRVVGSHEISVRRDSARIPREAEGSDCQTNRSLLFCLLLCFSQRSVSISGLRVTQECRGACTCGSIRSLQDSSRFRDCLCGASCETLADCRGHGEHNARNPRELISILMQRAGKSLLISGPR